MCKCFNSDGWRECQHFRNLVSAQRMLRSTEKQQHTLQFQKACVQTQGTQSTERNHSGTHIGGPQSAQWLQIPPYILAGAAVSKFAGVRWSLTDLILHQGLPEATAPMCIYDSCFYWLSVSRDLSPSRASTLSPQPPFPFPVSTNLSLPPLPSPHSCVKGKLKPPSHWLLHILSRTKWLRGPWGTCTPFWQHPQ
jgi:hypothetical protein